jgi:hypothetical protein
VYRSTLSSPLHWIGASDKLYASAALPLWKEPPVPLGSRVSAPVIIRQKLVTVEMVHYSLNIVLVQ